MPRCHESGLKKPSDGYRAIGAKVYGLGILQRGVSSWDRIADSLAGSKIKVIAQEARDYIRASPLIPPILANGRGGCVASCPCKPRIADAGEGVKTINAGTIVSAGSRGAVVDIGGAVGPGKASACAVARRFVKEGGGRDRGEGDIQGRGLPSSCFLRRRRRRRRKKKKLKNK